MKILQVIPYFCFGGAETMCENLTYALTKQGHSVTVVSLYQEKTPISRRMEEAGIRILYLDKKLGLDLSMVTKLAKIMRRERYDVVHTHLDVIKYAAAAAKLSGIRRCVHTVHNVAEEEAGGRLQRIINTVYFRLGWSVPVALSPEVQRTIVSFYGMKEETVPVVYNGVDLSRCLPKTDYGLSDPVQLLHIGRFNYQKNHRGLLEAARLILQKNPGCCLNLLGEGELRPEVEAYAEELGIREKVIFHGSRSNVYPYLHSADIFLLPSRFEGMPMTIIEAMGTGLPVVASAVGGVPDMLRDGESGILVSQEPESVAKAVLSLLEQVDLRQKLGESARKDSEKFSAEYMAEAYCRIYRA